MLKPYAGIPENVATCQPHLYDARVVGAGVAFSFTAAISVSAAGPEPDFVS
jgi:hypothetical protein